LPVEATVVSVIIRDFIYLTERLAPVSVAELIRDFYEKVSIQVSQQSGVLTSISNHSMTVFFPEVEGVDVHARRALRCALAIAMIAYQTRFLIRKIFPEQGLDKFGVGIGIHSGELMLTEFGLPPYVQKVASGHAVSIASLLAVKSKDLDWNVVCSKQVLNIIGEGVRTRNNAVVGADWLKYPVHVAEAVVVCDGEEIIAGAPGSMDITLSLDADSPSASGPPHGPESQTSADMPEIRGYRCMRLIGRGGMSRVFLVERSGDGTHLALKFADGSVSQDSEVLYRFVEEYGLLERMHHPNLLRIFEQGVTDDALFIVMEYLPGGTLKQHIGRDGIGLGRALRVLHEMVSALVEVHRMGIIHRDIKPENIMLRGDGAAVLGDFGVARRLYKARHGEGMEHILGTPYFMSPEQALGKDEDERTDVYSMGAVLFNMLTGEKPYGGDTLEAIVDQHLYAPVPALPGCYKDLQPLLDRMMCKDRAHRYSAADVLRHMETLESGA
jgi:class 3 adenylate cyclase